MKKSSFKKPTLEQVKAKQKVKWSNLLEGKESSLYKTWKAAVKPKLKRGSMVKPIPLEMREELAEDKFMKECCLQGIKILCEGEIQWHHALIYAGKRQNEKGAILPLCRGHHEKESQFRHLLNQIMYYRMTDEDRAKYPKRKWQ